MSDIIFYLIQDIAMVINDLVYIYIREVTIDV
jgi:hypothetical protein